MILVDWQIKFLCSPPKWLMRLTRLKPLVESEFDSSLVNPASLDIRVGNTIEIMVAKENPDGTILAEFVHLDISSYTKNNPYQFAPGDRILASSLETFNMPPFLRAVFHLKSSRAREFYQHLKAGFADPGWHNSKLTLELVNMSLGALPLYPGLKIGQLELALTLGVPRKTYAQTGRYNGDKTVMESKG
jgi:dCTP deaminase